MKAKRLISFILMLTILLSMMPAGLVSASTAEESTEYEYVFTAEVFPDELKTKQNNGAYYVLRAQLAEMTLDTPIAEKSDPWRIAGDRYVSDVTARPAKGLSGASTFAGFNIWTQSGDSSACFAMELKVERGGTYIPNLSYFATGAGTGVAIYLVKAGTELGGVKTSDFNIQTGRGSNDGGLWTFINAITEEQNGVYILKSPENPLNMYGTFIQGNPPETENFGNREIEIEDNTSYYLIIRRIGSEGNKQLSFHSFALKHPEFLGEVLSLSLTARANSILTERTLQLTATVEYENVGESVLTDGITYKSLNEDIATVSQKGVITGIKAGTATIMATVDGTDVSDTFTVTVKEPAIADKEYVYDFRNVAFGASGDVTQSELAEMTLGTVKPEVSEPWRVAGNRFTTDVIATADGLDVSSDRKNGDTCFAIELDVEAGGIYVPSLTYRAQSDASKINVYLVKEETQSGEGSYVYKPSDFKFDAVKSDSSDTVPLRYYTYFITEKEDMYILKENLDMRQPTGTEMSEIFANREIELEADTRYYLIFRVVGAVTNSTNHTIFKSFSLTPVTESEDEVPAESSDYEYVFTAEVFPDNLKDGNGYVQRSNLAAMTFDTPNPEKTDPWRAAADRYIDNVAARPATGLSGATTFTGFNIWSRDGDSSSCFAMELKVGKGGTYIPNLSYFATGAATDVAIYLVKAGTELGGVKTSDFKIQTSRGSNDGGLWPFILKITGNEEGVYILKSPENPLNMYGTFVQGGPPVTENFGNREIEIEDNTSYYLIIRRIGNTGSKQLSLHSFALKQPERAEKLLSLSLIAGGDSVLMGNTLPLTAMAKYELAGKKPLTSGITYESLNKDIAEVSSAGVIKGIKPGEATIKATVDGTDISATFKVTVKIPSGLGLKLFYADVKADPASVEVGKSAQIEATGYMSDGTVADMTNGRIIYESLTPDIVSVDENGAIKTLRAGEGSIAATLILDDVSVYEVGKITVTDSSKIVSASLSAPATVGYLRDEKLTLTGKMGSGYDADFTNADIEWIIECDPTDGVSIDKNNMIFGHVKDATATISATITLDGVTVMTNTIEITVSESDMRDFIINFGGVTEETITEVTIEKYGWQLDAVNSHSSVLSSVMRNEYINIYTNGVDRDFVIDFKVPYTGNYMPVFVATYKNDYGAEKVYIYIDGVYVGDYEFYQGRIETRNLRAVHLEAGTHKLIFRPATEKTISKNYYQYPSSVRFAAISSLPAVKEIATEKNEYEISAGSSSALKTKLKLSDGFVYEWQKMRNGDVDPYAAVEYVSGDTDVATVDENGIITAIAAGETTITVRVTLNTILTTKEIPVTVLPEGTITADETLDSVEIDAPFFVMNPESEGVQLVAVGKNAKGGKLDITGAEIIWELEDSSVVSISESGYATPVELGSSKVTATVTMNGITKTAECYISVRGGKAGRTYYTDEMVAAARENIKKYKWAKDEAELAVNAAEKYLGLEDKLWEMVPGEGIPRSITVGLRNDPDRYTCRYCGVNLQQKYVSYGWLSNPLQRPWKIQCPDCKRVFPSNEFDKFYELGRDEHGIFNRDLALRRHEEMFGGTYGTGYLKNTMYPEVGTPESGVKLTGDETVEKWGVDDGFGYDTGRVCSNGVKEIHTYIAYYNHFSLWYPNKQNPGILIDAVDTMARAYIYTGDEKYGRVGAILTDRIADVYPEYDMRLWSPTYEVSDGGVSTGITIGNIWECDNVRTLSRVYDAFFPMYDDPEVIKFLSEKAERYNNTEKNDKSTPEKIRKNVEDGVLRESFEEVQRYSISGNFGATQSAIGMAAIVLDSHPETDEIIDWLYAYNETDKKTYQKGGEINKRLINDVSRDGQGDESGPGYNRIWVNGVTEVASVLSRYDEYEGVDLYENPKFIGMIKSYAPLTIIRRGLAQIGDSGQAGQPTLYPDNDDVMINAFKETKDVEIAQHLYFIKGGDLKNIHYDIFTPDPESLRDEVEEIIETYGEYNYDKSSMLTGYGFGALRDGTLHKAGGSTSIKDTQRDFWMYFGGARSHSHSDKLNLGVEAYGLQMTSDLGYPETASADPNRNQWQNTTISHNTVVVNEKSQDAGGYSGTPLHFDNKDTRVKVMDVDASIVYAATSEYRRTIVMVDYDDEISYGIDFFKVLGGNDHLYSFHAVSEENPEISDNLSFKAQTMGSYASEAVPYGPDPWSVTGTAAAILKYPLGYTWLDDVKRADNPGTGEFYVDWKIKDLWKQTRNSKQDIHLRMTMVNDWAADEITLANGMPPRSTKNLAVIDHFEYMLVRRKGRDLNTLFTTVVEPYDGSRYIKSIENVPVRVVSGIPGKNDVAKAVKVELVDGRIDYIVYAQNNTVTYNVGDVFEFRGFVGVWTVKENADGNGFANVYSYVNDGEMIGNDTFKYENLDAAIGGTITDFRDELSFDNWIEAELDVSLTQEKADELSGRIINVEREALGNSTYVIESVDMLDETHARINLGNVTLISGFVDAKNEELGYKYDVEKGKTFEIPMAYEDNPAPVFDELAENITTSAGSSVSVTVNATGDEKATVTYKARTLPRGASFNEETGIFTWKPDSSQIGDNLVAIDAVDDYGRITTQYFTVTVYGSTTSKPSTEDNASTNNSGTSGGGGGGGGGAAPAPDKEDTVVGDGGSDLPQDNTDSTTQPDNTEKAPDASGETEKLRFTDLSNHVWAADAINTLADDGIVKGTTATTYSPANNITRADFALLLVRAFDLESDNAENFADVSASDYFAHELAIARNTGIVNGIGDNKYAPRNTITRQDMMVIVYRAMQKLNVGFGEIIEPQYEDFDAVADYATDAVSALIGAGIVNGKSGRIAPADYTTRAEVAVLIKRIQDYIKQ